MFPEPRNPRRLREGAEDARPAGSVSHAGTRGTRVTLQNAGNPVHIPEITQNKAAQSAGRTPPPSGRGGGEHLSGSNDKAGSESHEGNPPKPRQQPWPPAGPLGGGGGGSGGTGQWRGRGAGVARAFPVPPTEDRDPPLGPAAAHPASGAPRAGPPPPSGGGSPDWRDWRAMGTPLSIPTSQNSHRLRRSARRGGVALLGRGDSDRRHTSLVGATP
eukprot:gene4889-biopygen13081